MKCPICEGAELQDLAVYPEGTYAWSCPNCPAVLLEYYDDHDLDELKRYLNREPISYQTERLHDGGILFYCSYKGELRKQKYYGYNYDEASLLFLQFLEGLN